MFGPCKISFLFFQNLFRNVPVKYGFDFIAQMTDIVTGTVKKRFNEQRIGYGTTHTIYDIGKDDIAGINFNNLIKEIGHKFAV